MFSYIEMQMDMVKQQLEELRKSVKDLDKEIEELQEKRASSKTIDEKKKGE